MIQAIEPQSDQSVSPTRRDDSPKLDFLWLELTNRCNLRCVHCYAESGPNAQEGDRLTGDDYRRLIDEGKELGCEQIQFIGGEPTLNRELSALIQHARASGYSTVEIFTNLVHLSEPLLACWIEHNVSIATSFYSADADTHDRITQGPGSFWRTVANLERVVKTSLPLRAGIIEMEENAGHTDQAMDFLRAMGISKIGIDRLRKFGRAGIPETEATVTELCGNCAGNTLCVGPDGRISPCIMSKAWSVGSVFDHPLSDIVRSDRLRMMRATIYREVVEPRNRLRTTGGTPASGEMVNCGPCNPVCNPCNPWCAPGQLCVPCNPSGSEPCEPNGRCTPR